MFVFLLANLLMNYDTAINLYDSGEAAAIERQLIPLLLERGAIDQNSAVKVGYCLYWAREFDGVYEVARESIVVSE